VPGKSAQGIVIRQNPDGGVKLNTGSTVTLTVSSGPGNATVPPVENSTLPHAEQSIKQQNLKVGSVSYEPSNTVAKNDVINSDPASGTSLPVGSRVNLLVSSGKPLVGVPDVTGQSEAAARSQLQNAGFSVGTVANSVSSTATPGSVISQSPTAGTSEPAGTPVNLVLAKAPPAPPPVSVPKVTGQNSTSANSQLTSAGFKVVQKTQTVTKKKKNGVVLSQSPGAGSSAKKGSTVTIVVGQYQAPTSTSTTSTTTTTGALSPPTTTTTATT
jgi:eukaryotic-like serine/threonine-protein kinase